MGATKKNRARTDETAHSLARDVTEATPPETASTQAEDGADDDRYRKLFMESLSGVAFHEIICDEDGAPVDYRFLDANPAFEQLTGLRRSDIVGRTALEVFPNLEPVWIERYGRVALTGVPEQFEQYIAALDRHYLVKAYRPSRGQFAVVFQDVTAIRERTSFAETIVSSAGEGIVVFDRERRYVVFNPVMERITGFGADEVVGRTPEEVFFDSTHSVSPSFDRALAGETVVASYVEFVAPRSGRHFWLDATYQPHRNSRGDIVGVVVSVMNVTDRHNVGQALAQSEAEFRTIFDSVGDGVSISDIDGRFLEVNRVMCERLGYSRDELLAMMVSDVNPPEITALFAERTAQIIGGGVHTFESVHLRRDGSRIPIEAAGRAIEFRGRLAILTVQRDVTERKLAEAAHREQALFLQQLIDAIPIPITAKTPDGRIALCNDAFTKGPGLPKSETVGKTITELGRTGASLHEQLDRELLETGGSKQFEDWMGFADGTKRRLVLTKAAIKAQDGTATGIVTATMDITERYVAEQALRRSEQRFRTLFERAGDAILISDLSGRILEANKTACEWLGYSRDELLALDHTDAPGHPTPNSAHLAEILRSGSLVFETTLNCADGSEMPVDISAVRITLGETDAILTIARDMTDRKRAEAERAALEEQLTQAQKMESIGRLAGGIAHDFNNLLTAIRGNASLALTGLPSDSGAREDLEQIVASADRAAALTRQLLAFARRTVLQPEVVDLGDTLRRLEPMLTRLLGEDVSLVDVVGRGAFVHADPSQIEQMIVNLAVNAGDAMPEGGTLTIAVSVGDAGADAGLTADLTVTDTGVGMDEATLGRVFEPFFTTKDPGKGTGLGLSTVYGIVRGFGGTVTARSELGRGSTFTVRLPLVAPAPHVAAEEHPEPGVPCRRPATVMVVEDDGGVRRFACRVLEAAGYTVLPASGGPAAFREAQNRSIDLLLTDVVMPVMNGPEVAARLTAARPEMRVLYMSGHTEKGIVRDGVLQPDIRYLPKPFTSEALLEAVDGILCEEEGGHGTQPGPDAADPADERS